MRQSFTCYLLHSSWVSLWTSAFLPVFPAGDHVLCSDDSEPIEDVLSRQKILQKRLEKEREETVKKLEEQVKLASMSKEKESVQSSAGSVPAAACVCSSKLEEAIIGELNKQEVCVSLFLLSLADGLRAMPQSKFRKFQILFLNAMANFEGEGECEDKEGTPQEYNSPEMKEDNSHEKKKEIPPPFLSADMLVCVSPL